MGGLGIVGWLWVLMDREGSGWVLWVWLMKALMDRDRVW